VRRHLRHIVQQWVPEALRAPVRTAVQRARRRGSDLPLVIRDEGDHLFALVHGGLELRVGPGSRLSLEFQFRSDRDSALEMAEFLDAAKERSVLFDVGAHHALFSVAFWLARPGNRAVAFEPSPVVLPVARENVVLNEFVDRVSLRDVALGEGEYERSAALDVAGFARMGVASQDSVPISLVVRTLDSEVERAGCDPDLLKIDIEGFELEVLQRARAFLRRHHPLIFLELPLDELKRRGKKPRDVIDELHDHGYRELRVAGRRRSPASICDSIRPVVRLSAE
jgi:FkbM family methyltransferase